ncbi:MAG: histone deacetylase [Chloroflexota bacterium]|nr:histone deacetylase [Chloroflexota bacterium]
MPGVLLLTDPAMAAHDSPGHPERPARLAAAAAGVEAGAHLVGADLELAEITPADDEALLRIHTAAHVARLAAIVAAGGGWLDADTYVGPESVRAARLAAGGTVDATRAVVQGRARVAFAVVRPPGHHAARDRGAGFCLVNNIAISVAALRVSGLARRIAIVDWDVHHGDGTQAIFDDDPDLCYASTHQSPLYPGTGDRTERGRGAARGTKHNRPLAAGSGDDAFVPTWTEDLLPAVEAFRPDAICVSAGYDAHRDDPLAGLNVTEAGYLAVAQALGACAARLGLPGVALTLEGGYHLPALRASVSASVAALLAGFDLARGPG